MPDILPALAIISTLATIIGAYVAYLALRLAKPPKPPVAPSSTTILGASMGNDQCDLPTYGPGMKRMGLNRAAP